MTRVAQCFTCRLTRLSAVTPFPPEAQADAYEAPVVMRGFCNMQDHFEEWDFERFEPSLNELTLDISIDC